MKKKGFTLIEMLIVIVIIGILAVALIPRIGNARDRAADVARMADARSIATAIISYRLDNGHLPSNDLGELVNGEVDYGLGGMLPKDPDSGEDYDYMDIDGRHFMVCATLSTNAGNSDRNYCVDSIASSIKKNGLLARFAPEVHADERSEQCCKKNVDELEKNRKDIIDNNYEYIRGSFLIKCFKNESLFYKVGDDLLCPSDDRNDKKYCDKEIDGKYYLDVSKHDSEFYERYKNVYYSCIKGCVDNCNDDKCINGCYDVNGASCSEHYIDKEYIKYLNEEEYRKKSSWYKEYNSANYNITDIEQCIRHHNNGQCKNDGGNGGNSSNGSYMDYVKSLGKNKGKYYIYIQ